VGDWAAGGNPDASRPTRHGEAYFSWSLSGSSSLWSVPITLRMWTWHKRLQYSYTPWWQTYQSGKLVNASSKVVIPPQSINFHSPPAFPWLISACFIRCFNQILNGVTSPDSTKTYMKLTTQSTPQDPYIANNQKNSHSSKVHLEHWMHSYFWMPSSFWLILLLQLQRRGLTECPGCKLQLACTFATSSVAWEVVHFDAGIFMMHMSSWTRSRCQILP